MSSLPPSDQPDLPDPPDPPDPPDLPPSDLPPLDSPPGDSPQANQAARRQAAEYAPDAEDPQEGAVPPGYDWPTHGGYLGCLFGLIVSCLLCGLVGAPIAEISGHGLLAAPLAIGITLLLAALFAGILGRLGWTLGRRFYREYPQPAGSRTWYQQQEDEEQAERPQRTARRQTDAGYSDAQ